MPRKGPVPKREVLPDPMYNSVLVTKLLNNVMLDGKKGVAQKIVYGAFDIVAEKTGKDPLEAFEEALNLSLIHIFYRYGDKKYFYFLFFLFYAYIALVCHGFFIVNGPVFK